EKDAAAGQSEQLRPALELLLRILADLGRLRAGRPAALAPWQEPLSRLAGRPLDLKAPLEALSKALQSLARNPAPEPLLRELALQLS
ncbi:MAG TPA: hypothetical protein VFM16_05040, partial [Holophagaceae bacterium]|nr:hypothetical protein [Holophagaceae bacterium]